MVRIRPTLPGDTWLILGNLRAAEVAEFEALGVTSEECMRIGLAMSEATTLYINDEPAGMLGTMDFGDYRVPWGVFTTAIDRYPLAFLRFCRRWAKGLRGPAVNYVDARNERAVEWFAWLGFEIGAPQPYGLNGEMFRPVRLG
jgi:hypothetical protein